LPSAETSNGCLFGISNDGSDHRAHVLDTFCKALLGGVDRKKP
jgi:hypothetical protein